MSDLFLVLRERIDQVTEWAALGTETMTKAQKATGLSHERLARQLSISERTWRRWVERGEVPMYVLPAVAKVLSLEIERPARRSIALDDGHEPSLAQLAREVRDQGEVLERVLDAQERVESAIEEMQRLIRVRLDREAEPTPGRAAPRGRN